MIKPSEFISFLENKGIRSYSGVPCSYFKEVIRCLEDGGKNYYMAPNEGSALAFASGACLGGEGAAVMIQNSGLGNLINPLTSLCMIYKIPVLLFISGRAYGIPDEPQHEIMGAKMNALLSSLEVPHGDLPQDANWEKSLEQGIETMREKKSPVVFFVRQKTFDKFQKLQTPAANPFSMKRADAIKIFSEYIKPDDLVFATTGMISRELFAFADRPGNFYMQGSMGHIGAVALGAATVKPNRRVIVLDGDGAFLMHMGTASMIGHYAPENLVHVVLDNESYETTGDQNTTAVSSDFSAIAKACGYAAAAEVKNEADFRKKFPELLKAKGPSFLRVKINRLETKDVPRITTQYNSAQIAENFKAQAAGSLAAKT